jgi:hypothetical protein
MYSFLIVIPIELSKCLKVLCFFFFFKLIDVFSFLFQKLAFLEL